jgi:hypothetical protein
LEKGETVTKPEDLMDKYTVSMLKKNLTELERPEALARLDSILAAYCHDMAKEKDSLIARFILETGAKASELVLVEKETDTGRVFFPDFKRNYE